MQPYSDNIIFFDAEFSTINPYEGELLSIGLVKMNGEELYLELEYDGEVEEWVAENIMPDLIKSKVSREEAKVKIKEFVGNKRPFMVSYVSFLDAAFYSKLFADEIKAFDGLPPFHWIPIDFASILFTLGTDPRGYFKKEDNLQNKLGIDTSKYQAHNALDDAKLLRETYLKLFK